MRSKMKNAKYVKCQESGRVLVQTDDDNEFGFVLADDEQTWPGWFGPGVKSWKVVAASEVSEEDQEKLGWLLDE